MKLRTNIILLIFLLSGSALLAQETETSNEPIDPVMELTYLKEFDGTVNLRVSMVNYVNRIPVALPDLDISYYSGEGSEIELGTVKTDRDGRAVFQLESLKEMPASEDGTIRFFTEYKGTDMIHPTEAEIYIMDVNLSVELEMIDSIGTVTVRAFILENAEEVPVMDEDVYVYVSRMFADLPLGEDFLDEKGEFSIEVPGDIPGDAEGFIEIIARFDDHYLFGTVESRHMAQWGVATHHEIPGPRRTLWTQIAPKWMIVTLTILLVGVWSHYIFVIFQLFRIKKLGKTEERTNLV